jgi:pre-mRNA-splicing factor 38A
VSLSDPLEKHVLMRLRRYLRALTAFYIRLTFKSIDVYETLEPLLSDYRKLRVRNVGESRAQVRDIRG